MNQLGAAGPGGKNPPLAEMLKMVTTGPLAENLFGNVMKAFADNEALTNTLRDTVSNLANTLGNARQGKPGQQAPELAMLANLVGSFLAPRGRGKDGRGQGNVNLLSMVGNLIAGVNAPKRPASRKGEVGDSDEPQEGNELNNLFEGIGQLMNNFGGSGKDASPVAGFFKNPEMLNMAMQLMTAGQDNFDEVNPLLPWLQIASAFFEQPNGKQGNRRPDPLAAGVGLFSEIAQNLNEEGLDSILGSVDQFLSGEVPPLEDRKAKRESLKREFEEKIAQESGEEEEIDDKEFVRRADKLRSQKLKEEMYGKENAASNIVDNFASAFQGSDVLSQLSAVAGTLLSGGRGQNPAANFAMLTQSITQFFNAPPGQQSTPVRLIGIAQKMYDTYKQSSNQDMWKVVQELNMRSAKYQPRIHNLLVSNDLALPYENILVGIATVLGESEDSKAVMSDIRFLAGLIKDNEKSVIYKQLKPLILAFDGEKYIQGLKEEMVEVVTMLAANQIEMKDVPGIIQPILFKSVKKGLHSQFGEKTTTKFLEFLPKLEKNLRKIDATSAYKIMSDPGAFNGFNVTTLTRLSQAVPNEVVQDVLKDLQGVVDVDKLIQTFGPEVMKFMGNVQGFGDIFKDLNRFSEPLMKMKQEFDKKKESVNMKDNDINEMDEEDASFQLLNSTLRDAILNNQQIRDQFQIFMRDFIEKFLKRALKHEDYSKSVEKLMATDLLKHAEIPSLLLDMVLRPGHYETRDKVKTAADTFLESNEIKEVS